jgi:DnaJ-class molecular chaperone
MSGAPALRIALDLLHIPSRVHVARSEPLPAGVHSLLRVAVGEETEDTVAIASTGRSHDEIHRAAAFFIEQVLLHPDANSYRVLGATPQATTAELRRNMALLMRWLHPDKDLEGRRAMFANRVTRAWDDLKTADRRSAYDQQANSRRQEKKVSLAKKRRLELMKMRGEKGLAAPARRVHGSRSRSRTGVEEKESLLRRFVAWVGGLTQPYSR